ncbi:MAG: hypothetical protein H0T94_14730 [Acidimicrobiia bacterium]|nr:hypothetical protein [Acidimicrobiia bacterium]MDQ3500465.1 hypothetical protein [Actinomycetota bacterium]
MTRLRDRAKGLRGRLLTLATGLAVAWAGFWGLVTWNVFANNTGSGDVIGGAATAVAALLPAYIIYLRRKPADVEAPLADLPLTVRPEYRRLQTAHDQVTSLVTQGLIDENVMSGVDDRIKELIRLHDADVSNQELGGQPSRRLREQVDQLTDLLVGLADAALDRRSAALDSDDQAASSLREALGRMRAEERGYRELDELEDGN